MDRLENYRSIIKHLLQDSVDRKFYRKGLGSG